MGSEVATTWICETRVLMIQAQMRRGQKASMVPREHRRKDQFQIKNTKFVHIDCNASSSDLPTYPSLDQPRYNGRPLAFDWHIQRGNMYETWMYGPELVFALPLCTLWEGVANKAPHHIGDLRISCYEKEEKSSIERRDR